MRKKVVFLEENMINEDEMVIFSAGISYEVDSQGNIENEDCLKVPLNHIWVNFRVIFENKD